ncbi:MAG: hypothetical protein PHC61_14760 [Chitinivibrionales bacterium]|nr:hypothetical protein [Chitinivibrionales bacterium]
MPNKPLTVIFCLPGNNFSGKFLECWTNLLTFCHTNNIQPILSRQYSCNIYYVRNMCLGADVMRGKKQNPFNSQIDYDYIMWIDSDILFTPQHFVNLLNHKKDIVSGVYMIEGGEYLATVKDWDEEYFKRNVSFKFMTLKDIEDQKDLIDVSYTGMGFMLVRKGVFESLEYPWFKSIEKQIGDMVDFATEDVEFCLRTKEKGFTVFIDPRVRVGHEKGIIL